MFKLQTQVNLLDFLMKNKYSNLFFWFFMVSHKFKWISLIFPLKIANLNQFTVFFLSKLKSANLNILSWFLFLNHKFKLISLIFHVKIANSNQFTGFSWQKHKFKWTSLIFRVKIANSSQFTGFSCQNQKCHDSIYYTLYTWGYFAV